MDKESKILESINQDELLNKVILSWFPELKKKKFNSDEQAIVLYRVYLSKLTNQKAIDKINKKIILLEKFIFNISEYTDELNGIYFQDTAFDFSINNLIDTSKEFILTCLQKEIEFLAKDLKRAPKLKWIGGIGQLGKEFHVLYEKGYINSSQTDLINWIDQVFDYGGKKSTLEDVIRRGEERYPKN